MTPTPTFHEHALGATPIRALGLTIAGTPLEPLLQRLRDELDQAGLRHLHCHFYLSTEWGVPFDTIAVAIPFYLARPELAALHVEHTGHLEGDSDADILRYLRHEVGHAVNYGYKLYEREDWVAQFGPITRPYVDEYKPELFSRRHVRHLPGWYAQKHPDEDWAETFAVWLTPGQDWRADYAEWPEALARLQLCDQLIREIRDRPPEVTDTELDVDVSEISSSVAEFYQALALGGEEPPPGLDGALRAIFDEPLAGVVHGDRLPAAGLLRRLERDLATEVFRWTGHFPERTLPLVRYLARRAEALRQEYPREREPQVTVAVVALVTALAVNHVYRGHYVP